MQKDTKNGFIIAFVLLTLAVVLFAGLSIWSYNKFTSQRDSTESQINAAVEQAESSLEEKLQDEFTEEQKDPFRSYKAPADLNAIEIGYPKSWSGFVEEVQSGSQELSFIAHPSEVFADSKDTLYAFQLRLVDSPYEEVLNSYDKTVERGELVAKPYTLPSVQGSVGIQLTGAIETGVEGTVILIKVRDKTIVATSETPVFIPDFEEIMNEHVVYSP